MCFGGRFSVGRRDLPDSIAGSSQPQSHREHREPGEADIIVAEHRNGPTDTIVVVFQGHYARFFDMAQ